MRLIILIFIGFAIASMAMAQVPEKMSYQAVVRDSENKLVINQEIGMLISILQGSPNGQPVYTEMHNPRSNNNGLLTVEVGEGMAVSGTFSSINWAQGPYYIKTEIDLKGGTNYTITGVSQLLSVPYALHAKTADSITGSVNETDPLYRQSVAAGITNEDIKKWNEITDSLKESDPEFFKSPASNIKEDDIDNWNNKQEQVIAGDGIKIQGTVISIDEADTSKYNIYFPQNEFYLGQDTLGGIVFHVYNGKDGKQHGLIVSKIEGVAIFGANTINPDSTRSWDGKFNTGLITNSPAKTWIQNNFDSTWYLPAIDELVLLWANRYNVNKVLSVCP